jgi:KipI family sensor histidine kinase inhibitor
MKWRHYGRNGVLIDFAEKPDDWALTKRLRIIEALNTKAPPQLIDFVPGFTNVLIEFHLSTNDSLDDLARQTIQFLEAHARQKVPLGPVKRIPVEYDGMDLRRVADCNGITVEKVIKYHSDPVYKVHLLGFSPGFPYLGELHHKLHTPRLDSPRLRVAPGSVAIGGEHTGIYTVESPGGWNIIGRTQQTLFDLSLRTAENEETAFFLRPGDRVKFVPL